MEVKDPEAAKNRRISIIVQYQQPAYDPADDEQDPKDGHGKKDSHGEAKKSEHKPAKPSAAH